MARRLEFQNIVDTGLAAFISRNNDLNGYWALGQLRNWLEDESAAQLVIPLMDGHLTGMKTQIFLLSQRFTEKLQFWMEGKNMPLAWVQDARLTVELTLSDRMYRDRMSCSFRIVSDLGRSFEAIHTLPVRRHDPRRESKRVITKR